MLSYKESLKILKETNALLEGHFILSSGLHSKQYIQCAKLLSHPEKAELICSSLTEKIKQKHYGYSYYHWWPTYTRVLGRHNSKS